MRKGYKTTHPGDLHKFYGKTKATNVIKSLVYSWFQLYERPLTPERVASQMELLDDKVRILTSLGSVSGKDEIPTILHQLENRKTSFNLDNINVYPCGVNLFTAECQVSYQCENDQGKKKNLLLKFEADLKCTSDFNFKFIRIKLKTKEETASTFSDNYPLNRSKSLVHHCMGLIEYDVRDPQTLSECFLAQFEIHPLNSEVVKDSAQLINWIENINELIQGLAITPVNFIVNKHEKSIHTYRVEFDLLFEGKDSREEPMYSLSKNVWIIQDNPNELLPKISFIHVEKLEPIFI